MSEPRPRLRRNDLPFERIAVVLSGGGALGAYEVGVLRALETAGLRPSILAGVSVGAVNAVLWLANGFRTSPLEQVWATLRPSSVGLRWASLVVRALGVFIMAFAALQIVLMIAGSPELSPRILFPGSAESRSEFGTAVLDVLAWLLVLLVGVAVARGSRGAEDSLARFSPPRDPHRLHRWAGWGLLIAAVLHLTAWVSGIPWPQRFSALLLLVGVALWVANRPGQTSDRLRQLFLRLLPDTGGRGLWSSAARRRIIQRVVEAGDPGALVGGETHLIISALAIESGQMGYFVNWPDPSDAFRARITQAVGQVTPLSTPEDVIEAAVASSAIPAVFEPVRIGDGEFLDGGVFTNQPLHAVLADGADAILIVIVAPSGGPPKNEREPNLFQMGARLLEIANWRDLQTELRALPEAWAAGDAAGPGAPPARVCVIEPASVLPGGLYGFSPANAAELRRRGEWDAWEALARAGWLDEAEMGPVEPLPPAPSGARHS